MASALIVVDVQNGFLREGNLASDRCLAVLPAIREEVERALAADERVFFTADTHETDDAEFEIFPEHCVRGSHEAELVDELAGYLDRGMQALDGRVDLVRRTTRITAATLAEQLASSPSLTVLDVRTPKE